MRKTLIPLLLTLAFSVAAVAQVTTPDDPAATGSPPAVPDATSIEATHEELRVLKATMETAINNNDIDTLLANVEDEVVFTTMNSDVVVGKDAIRAYFNKMSVGPDRVVDKVTTRFIPDAKSILYGDDIAIAYGHTDDNYVLRNGTEFNVNARWSTTMRRSDGHWRVASFHYSVNMFDNPILAAQRKLLVGIALVGSLLLAAVGYWLGSRRRRAAGR